MSDRANRRRGVVFTTADDAVGAIEAAAGDYARRAIKAPEVVRMYIAAGRVLDDVMLAMGR